MTKAAVYSGTKNVYQELLTAAKSLLEHSDVEKIYFLIEDDIFPYELPKEIECINVSNQVYFDKNGPNYDNVCTYMVLLRAAYSKIFPNLDRILSIDMDTIVNENISDLWDLDLTNYYIAAVEETELSEEEGSYFNMGVAMLNLKKIREDKKDDEMIEAINTYWYRYKEQDCFNEFFRGYALILPSDYNCCMQAAEPQREKITHFAGLYKLDKYPHFNYYRNLPIDKIQRNIQDKITLDIIIATYKNKKGLKRTLDSIEKRDDVNIIVVDDCSNLNYDDILEEYPYISFYQLETNSGPGMARQYGIEHSNGTYFTFLDTDDYFYDSGLETILEQINKNTYIKMYDFSYVYDDNNHLNDIWDDKTIGSVYKRSFVEMYNIHFCKEGSYANEDYGFSRACRIILKQLHLDGFAKANKLIKIPVFYEHIDKNSVTKKNNSEFFYTKLSKGIIINGVHALNIAKQAKITPNVIMFELNYMMAQEYFFFLSVLYERQDLIDDVWEAIRQFYFENYRVYEKFCSKDLLSLFFKITMPRIKTRIKKWQKIKPFNIMKFVQDLKTNEFIPFEYLT